MSGVRGIARVMAIVAATLILVLGCLAAVFSAETSPWHWSPAADHQAAVVLVRTPDATGVEIGSGCYVEANGLRGILTASHVLGSQPSTVYWSDGTKTNGPGSVDKFRHDVGWIQTENPRVTPLQLAAASPVPGQWLEFCGYGGPRDQLRHYWGQLSDSRLQSSSVYTCPVLQGDSGGPILTADTHEVVGVVAFGSGTEIGTVEHARAYANAGGPDYAAVTQFVSRLAQQYRGIGIGIGAGCFGGSCGPQPSTPPSDQWAYPSPSQSPIQKPPALIPVQPPVQPPVMTPAQPVIDYDQLAAAVAPLLASDPTLRGPAGPAGPAATIDYDALTTRLPPVKFQILDQSGAVSQEQTKPLGQPIRLQLVPR